MRLDVREQTAAAGKAELEHNDTYVTLVSRDLVDEWPDWSPPLQFKVMSRDDGLLELMWRTLPVGADYDRVLIDGEEAKVEIA